MSYEFDVKIKKAKNGLIVDYYSYESEQREQLVVEHRDGEPEAGFLKEVFYVLRELLETDTGTNRSDKHLYFIVAPGTKHGDYDDNLSKYIFGD